MFLYKILLVLYNLLCGLENKFGSVPGSGDPVNKNKKQTGTLNKTVKNIKFSLKHMSDPEKYFELNADPQY